MGPSCRLVSTARGRPSSPGIAGCFALAAPPALVQISRAFELLEQVERGCRDDNHELSVWIAFVDFSYRVVQFGAIRSLIGHHEVTSHDSMPTSHGPPVKSSLLLEE